MMDPTRLGAVMLGGAALLAACSGSSSGSSGGGATGTGFQLIQISVFDGAIWQINREIEFVFSDRVDFSSVSLNTINLHSQAGAPAIGSFFFRPVDADGDGFAEAVDETRVVFQPRCPTVPDLSDAGLQAGGVHYVLTVLGADSGMGNTIRSRSGKRLTTTQIRNFQTPASTNPGTVFVDTMFGPPVPIVRTVDSMVADTTHMEVGDDASQRVYFELDTTTGDLVTDPLGFEAPLNLYSDQATHVAVVIEFNQAVSPNELNISSDRLRLEYLDPSGFWLPVETAVELVANCTANGARVRLEPIGILPSVSRLRAVVQPGFQDITLQNNLIAIADFAELPIRAIDYSSLDPSDLLSDEILEGFDFGGSEPGSLEDDQALFPSPTADWGDGALVSAFDFEGMGGPGGDFDWVIPSGVILNFDTTTADIVGGPGGLPTTIQHVDGGVVDVRNLVIEEGGEIRVTGTNTMVINASGSVYIGGKLDISGFSAKDVSTLNTGNQVEVGGAGVGGGGRGGDASIVLNNSTPRGGRGFGPFGEVGTGGEGGESAYALFSLGKEARRPGGGGGGRFASDACVPELPACMVDLDGDDIADQQPGTCTNDSGLYASSGCPGGPGSRGATTGMEPAQGGRPGLGAFLDGDPENDYFGVRPVVDGSGNLVDLVQGELSSIWAGYGGGGGGDAIVSGSFPPPSWNPANDEKAGGGGGAAGGLEIRALGRFVFGPRGLIVSNGARGATGENTNFLDHVGGTGGSGSGGHVILESATEFDFTDGDPSVELRDWVAARGGPLRVGAQSGQTGDNVPAGISHGGQGGPGVIQLHVPNPVLPPGPDPATTDIVVPLAATMEMDPLDGVTSPAAYALIPRFGATSRARSKWISIGAADRDPGGGASLVEFLFAGIEETPGEDEGKILTQGGVVADQPPLLGPETIPSPTVVLAASDTVTISGASLTPLLTSETDSISNDIYLRTPSLLRDFCLRLFVAQTPLLAGEFDVEEATYDDANQRLTIVARSVLGTPGDFLDSTTGQGEIRYELIPRFFRVLTEGTEDSLPPTAYVRILFQAAGEDGLGRPDEANPLVDWTADISRFNALEPGELSFFRFMVEFNLDAASQGVSLDTPTVAVDFLKIPFRF